MQRRIVMATTMFLVVMTVITGSIGLLNLTVGDSVQGMKMPPGVPMVMEHLITSAERHAAADRAAAARRGAQIMSGVSLVKTAIAPNEAHAATTTTDPKTPDYFGTSPNYANSPLPPNVVITPAAGDTTGTGAEAIATVQTVVGSGGQITRGVITSIKVTNSGSGYTAPPQITIDPTISTVIDPATGKPIAGDGAGATAQATLDAKGHVSAITLSSGGSDYGGIRKFVDSLPGLTAAGANTFGQYIQLGVPDTTTYPGSDYYEIGLVEYSQQFHSDLPASNLRGYVQLNDPATTYQVTRDASGKITGWPQPHYLGPTIVASRDRPVRIKFVNLLPTGTGGDLFIPMDNTVMGAGEGPTQAKDANGNLVVDAAGKPVYEQYTQNRATLHLHGGLTPWISDGTPHQWTTPAGETTSYPKGVSTQNVPDMPATGPGEMTFFYSNQQSARLMFYHDHAYGITRLNVYAGEAAGYLLTDQFEGALIKGGTATGATGASVTVPAGGVVPDIGIPLVIQDKTFVPGPKQLAAQDPTWNHLWRTGVTVPATGSLWMPHVYMTNQNPNDLSGTNAMGRWDYSQWFWPPTAAIHGTLPNPFYNPATPDIGNSEMPGTNNPSITPESFMDTPIVNGVAYPYVKLSQKVYRFRILNAANDRSLNLQFYYAKSRKGDLWDAQGNLNDPNAGEVDLVPANGPATPMGVIPPWPNDNRMGGVPNKNDVGPSWIQLGTEGGFLPAPAVIASHPVGYENNLRNIVVTNINVHSLMLAPAERADVIVDFSKIPDGSKLILYNDSPAPVPAFDPRYDYYTGDLDQSDTGGAPTTLAGYGPNTRTIMQIQISGDNSKIDLPNQPNPYKTYENDPDKMSALTSALNATFAASQDPIIVPEPDYNTVYGKTFKSVVSRIQNTSLTFTPNGASAPITIGMKPKAIQELFETQYGRMNATLGVEIPNTTGVNQTTIPLGYIDPATESIDDSVNAAAPLGTPQGTLADGTQIWKITHNGVDTHAIHFHLFNVQIINRVGWDGQVRVPEANEIGWKDTVRMNPLEDAIVALRPIAAKIPFGTYQSIRPLDVTMPLGSRMGFWPQNEFGNPVTTINTLYNFGDEYVWHCHLLGHEENDMMRPIVFNTKRATPPAPGAVTAADAGNKVVLDWADATPPTPGYGLAGSTWSKPEGEIGYIILRHDPSAAADSFVEVGRTGANVTTYTDSTVASGDYSYKVVAFNDAGGSSADIGSNTALSPSAPVNVTVAGATVAPTAPTGLAASFLTPALGVKLTWTAATGTVDSYTVTRSGGQSWTNINGTTFTDSTNVGPNTSYTYTVTAVNSAGSSPAATLTVLTLPDAPTGLASVTSPTAVTLNWNAPAGTLTSYTVERSSDLISFQTITTTVPITLNYTDNSVQSNASYFYRVRANNATGASAATPWLFVTVKANLPPAPTGLNIILDPATPTSVSLNWTSGNINIPVRSYLIERGDGTTFTQIGASTTTSYVDTTATANTSYYYRIIATNSAYNPSYDPNNSILSGPGIVTLPNAPTVLAGALNASGGVDLTWTAPVGGADTYTIKRRSDAGANWNTLATAWTPPTTAVNGTTVTYTDATAQANTTYIYEVTAYNVTPAAGLPATSLPVVMPPALPNVATGLTAPVSASGVALSWTAPTSVVTSYRIERQNSALNGVAASGWQTVGTSTTPAFTDTGATSGLPLDPNTYYDYQVFAINSTGTGPASNPVTALTLPAAPAPLQVDATTAGVTVSWPTTPAGNGTITGYTIDRSADGGANWTNLTSSAVNSSTAYNTYLDTSVLAANSNFVYRVSATNASGTGASASITALTVPAAPTNLNGAVNASGVLLTWTVPAGGVGTITGYTVERSDGQSWTTTGPGTSYTDSTTAAGNTTYTYTVKANNSSGSGPASAGKIILTLPGASTNLAATALSPVGVSLTWTPPSGNGGAITGYMVYRSTDNGATWAPANGTMTPGAPFIDTTAAANTNYAYGIIAYNATGAGPASAASNNVLSVPAAPSVSAVVQAGPQVVLTMVSTGGNGTITGYTIQRRTSATAAAGGRRAVAAGPWATIATVTTGTSYTDGTGLTLNASYDYQVSASNTPAGTTPVLYGAYSAALKVTATPPLPPTAPTNLTARASGANVVLSWRNNTTNQTSVIIERATSAATLSFTQIGTVAGTATTFTDATVAPTTTYVYQVRAVNAVGSTLSAQVTFTTPAPPLPTAPTRLRAAASGANVVLTWTNGTNQTNIVVQRANSGTTTFTTLATLGATATTYSDATAVQGTAYTYQVYATNAVGSSPMVQVTFTLPLAAPTGLVGTPNVRGAASKFVTLTWTNNAPAATGFIVERLVGATWTAVTTGTPTLVTGSTTSWTITDTGITATGSYRYRVRAITATAASANATVTVRVQ